MSFNAEFNFPVPIISKYIKFTIRFRIEHIGQLFSLKEPFDTILNVQRTTILDLCNIFLLRLIKSRFRFRRKKRKKFIKPRQTRWNRSLASVTSQNPSLVPTKFVQTVTNDDQREATRSNRGERIGNPPSNVLISRKTIIFESTRPPTRARSIRG